MQRAVSVCKLIETTKAEQVKEAEMLRLGDLLPHGLMTRVAVDVLRTAVCANTQRWKIRVPTTLLSTPSGIYLLTTSESGSIHTQKYSSDSAALSEFARRLLPPSSRRQFPAFTYRSADSPLCYHMKTTDLAHTWVEGLPAEQTLQEFVQPPSSSLSVLRAHWKKGKKRTVYYTITKKPLQRRGKLPCLTSKLSEYTEDGEDAKRSEYSVTVKSPAECWALKRIKPIAEVNAAVDEVRRIMETAALPPRQYITEIVCDFAADRERRWVLLKCRGFAFQTSTKVFSQSFEQKHKIDLKFILFPLFHQKQLIGQRIRAANHMDDSRLNSDERRISILGISEMRRLQAEEFQSRVADKRKTLKHRVSFLHRDSMVEDNSAGYNSVVRKYDDMMGRVKRYKLEKKGMTNFIEKYGGRSFWDILLQRFQHSFTSKSTHHSFSDQLSVEESDMMVRGYRRVLEGNFNMYYKQSLRLLHRHKGITTDEFFVFLREMEEMLLGADIDPQDSSIVLRRFKAFEVVICTEAQGHRERE